MLFYVRLGGGHVDFNEFVRGVMPEDYPGQKKNIGLGVQSLSPHANSVAPKANIYLIGGESKHLDSMEGQQILTKDNKKAEVQGQFKKPAYMRERPKTAGSSRPSTGRSAASTLPCWERPGSASRPGTASSTRSYSQLPGPGAVMFMFFLDCLNCHAAFSWL